MRAEFDLPRRFLALHMTALQNWLETAKPGSTLCIHLGDQRMLAGWINSMAVERNTADLTLCYERAVLVVKPADAHSRRLVDLEEEKLRKAEAVHNPGQSAASAKAEVASLR